MSFHQNSVQQNNNDKPEETVYDMNSVNSVNATEVFTKVKLRGKDCVRVIEGKIDTGAMVNCMPLKLFENLNLGIPLKENIATQRGLGGNDLGTCGAIDLNVTCNNIIFNRH